MCVCLVGGVGETDLLLHLLTNVAPFKEVGWSLVCVALGFNAGGGGGGRGHD